MRLLPFHRTAVRHFAVGLLLLACSFATAWWLLRHIGERALRAGAEQIAVGHAQFMHGQAPGLDRLFEQRTLDDTTRDQLARVRQLGEVFGFELFDAQGRPLLASEHLDASDPVAASRRPGPTAAAAVAADAVPAAALAGRRVVELQRGPGDARRPSVVAMAFVPAVKEGRVIGVTGIRLDHSARFERMRIALMQAAAVIGLALALVGCGFWWMLARQRAEYRNADERLRFLVAHDALSGALNRHGFHAALQHALDRWRVGGEGFALLCIDLDRFKDINDAHGHAVGDEVLRRTTERLRSMLRHGDRLARLGADEFAVLQSGAAGHDDVARLAQRIVEALGEPFETEAAVVHCSASVGAVLPGDRADRAAELLHRADVALTHAKRAGRDRVAFYDAEIDRQQAERRALAEDLRHALGDGSLALHYQPLFARDGRTLLGYEALMRWRHPRRGMVPPSVFIPLAEATGQIEALGTWALETACAEAARWPGALTVSVNLSAAQFQERGDASDLASVVRRCLRASGLPAERLVLEVTESLLMSDADSVVCTLNALALMHVHVAMDDFGTGYSSLGSLWRFPFDKVKIDRAFTKGLESDDRVALIVRSIVSLAHSLGMRVTAEGVETAPQAPILRHLGCDELQGFLLGRPEPAEALVHEGAIEREPDRPTAPDWGELVTRSAPL